MSARRAALAAALLLPALAVGGLPRSYLTPADAFAAAVRPAMARTWERLHAG